MKLKPVRFYGQRLGWAVLMACDFTIMAADGVLESGRPGDYLFFGLDGSCSVIA